VNKLIPRLLLLAALAAFAPTSPVDAQTISRPVPPVSPAECAEADQTLRTGDLAQTDSQRAALTVIGGCVNGADAMAVAMQRRRNETLSADMYSVFSPVAADTALLRTALELAADASAGLPARVLSLRLTLAYLGVNWFVGYNDITSAVEGTFCMTGPAGPGIPTLRSNLPADAPERIRQQAMLLERDVAQPAAVRSAANCVMNAWRSSKGLSPQLLVPDVRSALSLEYVCGNQFRIKSTVPHEVVAEYEVQGTAGRKTLHLARRKSGQSFGETVLDLDTSGELRLLFDGDVIHTKANGGTTCP
jgi:hypothetical protein